MNNILIYSNKRYRNLKQKWIVNILLEHELSNNVNNSYLEKVALDICDKFDT